MYSNQSRLMMFQWKSRTRISIYWLGYCWNTNVINIKKITKYRARWVMDGSRAQMGVAVFDTYAPVIDYSTVLLLFRLAFGNNWEMFHLRWDISVSFTNAKSEEETYVRFPKSFQVVCFQELREVLVHHWNEICTAANQHQSCSITVYINL